MRKPCPYFFVIGFPPIMSFQVYEKTQPSFLALVTWMYLWGSKPAFSDLNFIMHEHIYIYVKAKFQLDKLWYTVTCFTKCKKIAGKHKMAPNKQSILKSYSPSHPI